MFSALKNLKKYDRSLYDQIENMGMSNAYKAVKPEPPPMEKQKAPKFSKLKDLMKK